MNSVGTGSFTWASFRAGIVSFCQYGRSAGRNRADWATVRGVDMGEVRERVLERTVVIAKEQWVWCTCRGERSESE